MSKKLALICLLAFFVSGSVSLQAKVIKRSDGGEGTGFRFESVVKKEQRKVFVKNEFGEISAVDVGDGVRGHYHIHFFTLEPNSLLLPLLLHADMTFFVHTGSGKLSWTEEEETKTAKLKRGDIFSLRTGSAFSVQSDLRPERESLRIYALFEEDASFEREFGAYSSVRNLLRGFDKTTLKQAFKVSEDVIESITSAAETEGIVHAISTKDKKEKKKKEKKGLWEIEDWFLQAYVGGEQDENAYNKKKKTKGKGYNLFEEDPDFENRNGWSLTVIPKKAGEVLGESGVGLFMVNLTEGSMMGPHWNPRAMEISIVLRGRGMVRVVCSSINADGAAWNGVGCENERFLVDEGDVFAVPRFHPMAQMSFNNGSLVFMGFATSVRENHPQFLAGKQSVLRTLDRDVLAASFNVPNATVVERLLALQADSIILDCTSCAEEEERKMVEEEEAARKREEEERRKREEEEEEERRREEEEEERRKREEEERKKEKEEREREREEEERRKKEEEEREREREEEERRKREEEERKKREEEEREREREEEERRKQEEEEREREREEEERRKEEARKREEEEERQIEKQRQEEEQKRQREEEEEREREKQRREEEERERERQQEEKEARRREEEEEERQRREEEEEEERQRQEKEEARRQEEEEERQRREEEEERQRQEEEEASRQEEEEEERQREEEEEEGGEGRALLKDLKVERW